jgi:hypothetical protein
MEAEVGRWPVQGQPGLHRKTLSQIKKKQKIEREKKTKRNGKKFDIKNIK